MEDSVTESEKQVVFTTKIDDHEKEEKTNEQVEKEEQLGFIKQVISNFTPVSKQEDENTNNKLSEENEEDVKKEGGGLFSHIISNLVSSPRGGDGKQREGVDVFETPEKDGGAGDGGGGIIDNIVSNLPNPLPDDAAPATDEASILIHSIIHD